jgi:DNA polymerase elongation subunit (family B)
MNFYTNIYIRGNEVLLRGIEDGEKIQLAIPYKPYLFVPSHDSNTPFKTLKGQPVKRIDFESMREARDYVARYKNVENFPVYGLSNFGYTFINDKYKGEIQYDVSKISVVTIDIETASDGGFPDIETANKQITAITLRKNDQVISFGLFPYEPELPNVKYFFCESEAHMLEQFIQVWCSKQFSPDIITGWNVEFFDMPYIVNRIRRILGDYSVKKLSPWGMMSSREFEIMGKTYNLEQPVGITILDYMALYKKFSFSQQESFKLDHVSFIELGERKLDFTELGFETLDDFYKGDFRNYMNYNIRDVDLVYRLDQKLKLIEQVFAIAYDGKVNYIDTLATVRMWDTIIHNYLLEKNIVVDNPKVIEKQRQIEGAYVKDPQVGKHDWVVSFDLNSLYPHLIMQYNISPETLTGQYSKFANSERFNDDGTLIDYQITDSIGMIIDDKVLDDLSIRNQLTQQNVTITPTGCMFDRDYQGFLPKLMETMYNDRSTWKKRMLEAKKKYEKTPTEELANEVARCHNMQLAKKIQLNSAYGALSNVYFRWYDPRLAESITKAGQLSIRWVEKKMNEHLNKLFKTTGEDYVIACDTDSMYIRFQRLVDMVYKDQTDHQKIVSFLDKACEEKFEPFIDKCYEELAIHVNGYQQKMKMKREAIANKGIWTAKKHYILNVYNNEGVSYKEPKLKMQGIEAVRSSTPSACRDYIKKSLGVIMNGTQDELIGFIERSRIEFKKKPFEEIAFPRSVRGLKKYYDSKNGYKKASKAGVPIHVRAALVHNHLVKTKKLDNTVSPIYEGEKIKFAYLTMPNPVHENVFATTGPLPKQFGLEKYIDYETQFDKAFVEPIRTIVNVMGWTTEKASSTLDDFFGD